MDAALFLALRLSAALRNSSRRQVQLISVRPLLQRREDQEPTRQSTVEY